MNVPDIVEKHIKSPCFARLPFAWNSIEGIATQFASEIKKTEEHLIAIRQILCSEPELWQSKQIPWLNTLLNTSLDGVNTLLMSGTNDREIEPCQRSLIDLLVETSTARRNTHDIDLLRLYLEQPELLRSKSAFAYGTDRSAEIYYYPKTLLVPQLIELVVAPKRFPILPPILLSCASFAHFLTIHPFLDGNGRSARLLLLGLLRRFHVWGDTPLPIGFLISCDRAGHVDTIRTLQRESDWSRFVPYMLSLICAAAELSVLERYYSGGKGFVRE